MYLFVCLLWSDVTVGLLKVERTIVHLLTLSVLSYCVHGWPGKLVPARDAPGLRSGTGCGPEGWRRGHELLASDSTCDL